METQSLLMETGVLCVPNGGGCSGCAGADCHYTQQRCRRYEKATDFNRCMYLVFEEYCDNHLAQATANGHVIPIRRKKKRLIRDEDEYDRRLREKKRTKIRRVQRRGFDDPRDRRML